MYVFKLHFTIDSPVSQYCIHFLSNKHWILYYIWGSTASLLTLLCSSRSESKSVLYLLFCGMKLANSFLVALIHVLLNICMCHPYFWGDMPLRHCVKDIFPIFILRYSTKIYTNISCNKNS